MPLELEKIAIEDYSKARENILQAEREEGSSWYIKKVISEINEKLDCFHKNWIAYENNKNDKSLLQECLKCAREARLESTNILERAKSIDIKKGLKLVISLGVAVFIIFCVYVLSHLYWGIPWFQADFWWEVIFFSIFGVFTNLSYRAASHVLRRDFDQWHLGWYISKIIQAPFISLAIILILRSVHIEALGIPINFGDASNELLAGIAYILGLFSRRAWSVIERIKDWILPKKKE